jgi:carbamoyltransferase
MPFPASRTDGVAPPRAVVHVDLDGAPWIYRHHGWPYAQSNDPIFESGLENLLVFLERNALRATLFVIAQDLEQPGKRALLERAVAAGHEIASHSLTHPEFDPLDREAKRVEVETSKRMLEDALGVSVRGFRTPNYQIDRETLELLDACGYAWDSSVFPERSFARRLELPSVRPLPHRPLHDRPLVEIPLPAYRPAPFPFSASYALLLGQRYFDWQLARFERRGLPLVMLLHLVDFADPLPRDRLPGAKARLFTLSHRQAVWKAARCQRLLDRARRGFEFVATEELLAGLPAESLEEPVVLGLSTTHETAATLVRGTRVLASVSEERLDRVKFSTAYPPLRAIEQVIETAGIDPAEIGDVAIGGLPPERLWKRTLGGQLRDALEFHGWNDYFPHFNKLLYRAFYFVRSLGYRRVRRALEARYGIRPRLHFVPHHQAHAAGVYRSAPFDDALVVTADGVGDEVSITVSEGRAGRMRLLGLVPYPHSLGQFYTACTQMLGFRGGRHEGKITGLSGFGAVRPDLYAKVKSTIRQSGPDFRLDKRFYSEGIIRGFSLAKLRGNEDLFDALQYRNYKAPLLRVIEGHTREDVAAVFQKLLEDELVELVRPFAEKTGLRNLCLSGGVFANVKANAALFRSLGFEQVYIYPNMGDGGLGHGAALELLQARPAPFDTVYWGPEYSDAELERALTAAAGSGLRFRREENIERAVAELVAGNKVVARYNGRMEFGPRALGNRSILYNAGEPEANHWLNKRLGRTEFMPFAPIAMAEHATNLFKSIEGTEHACKFMTIILECTDWTKEKCPAIVHVDGTARPQLVSEATNPSMYRILAYYEEQTGIPLMVNTSFNMHEEPIVCTPEDAVRAFLSAGLDALALGPYLAWIEASGDASR